MSGDDIGHGATRPPDGLSGGGEMGARMRAFDWPTSPVGDPAGWPHSLKTAVSICLGSRYPIVIWWGNPAYTMFYNDAYISFLGATKHPGWLGRSGRECWSEIWPTIGPMLEGVFATGEATWSEDLLLVLHRNLPREEGYFTFSYSPIRDDSGAVGGIFCACYETTGRVIGERRLRTLRDLARIVEAKSAEEACAVAARTLAENPADLPFALLYLVEGEGREARLVAASGLAAGTAPARERIDLGEPEAAGSAAWPLRQAFDTAAVVPVADLAARFGPLPQGPWPEPPEAALVVPIAAPGQTQPTGFLVAALSPRRVVDADYRSFFELIAGHLGTAIANARAYEEERRRAEALSELDRAKTAFFSNVSHEFRTPLTLLLGPVEELRAMGGGLSPAAVHERLDLLHRNALRLQKLVNTLLDFSRIEAGRARARYEPTDLAAVTAELASSFRSAVETAGMRLLVRCPPLAAPVYVDRDLWEKVVLNLLSNAFKFTLEGEIEVALRAAGGVDGMVELAVRDTGSGIPEAQLPHLFERFHRIPGTRARTHEGTGIGLALVQELVKLHGGTVEVTSVEGRGSTFTVRIPLGSAHLPPEHVGTADPASPSLSGTGLSASHYVEEALRWLPGDEGPSAGGEPMPDRAGPAAGTRPRVLWADDNADLRAYVGRLLGARYDVVAVADGEAALAAARRRPPDLVLADVMMPRLDGFGLLRALRADERLCTVPVLLLSARAGEEARVEGLRAGADDYLVKPFGARELLARVEAALAVARLRREQEAALREADRRKDEFLATLAHELRNPLAPIRNSLHLLRLAGGEGEAARQAHGMLERQVDHMVRLVDDLMEVSRITRGKIALRRERVELAAVVRQAVETSRPLLEAAGHRLALSLPAEPLAVEADPVRLAQVFSNLLNNAAKYTDSGGRIWLEVRRDGGEGVVVVRDTGVGIPAELLPRVFEMFTQVDRTLGRSQGGLGIGLALVQSLVQLHGGTVQVESAGQSRGSEFTVRLPLALPRAAEPARKPVPMEVEAAGPPARRVLVVDDNQDAADSTGMLLTLLGSDVQVVYDGAAALEAVRAQRPDVVLLDLGMPGMDGHEVARRVRRQPELADVVLIALTGWGQEEDRARTAASGFDHHLVKPVALDALQGLLAALDRQPARASVGIG